MLSPYPHIWFKPPIPFGGSKRQWRLEVLKVLSKAKADVIVDLFGGSGLLSRWAKDMNPYAKVIWNDYDDYLGRLNQLELTNKFIAAYDAYTRTIGVTHRHYVYLRRGEGDDIRNHVLDILKQYRDAGGCDDITIRSFLTLHNRGIEHTLEKLVGEEPISLGKRQPLKYDSTYLAGISRVRRDWAELAESYDGKALFLADPPYEGTHTHHYEGHGINHTQLSEFLSRNRHMYFTNENATNPWPTYDVRVDKVTQQFNVTLTETMLYKV